MTITLGWKSGVAAAFLLACLAIWGMVAYKNAQQESVVEYERRVQLKEMSFELADAIVSAKEAHEEADALRSSRQETAGDLEKLRKALRRSKKKPVPQWEEMINLREHNALLEQHLAIAEDETVILRTELVHLKQALGLSENMFELQSKRLEACHDRHKKQKRRNALSYVGIASGALIVGFGLGSI